MPTTRMAGIATVLGDDAPTVIPSLWETFGAGFAASPHEGDARYGVCTSRDGEMHYMAATAVREGAALPDGWQEIVLPARRYAVFPHEGDVMTIRQTIEAAGDWLERSGLSPEDTAAFLERYGPGFDAETGEGDIEIWMPLRR
jgi:AraC family transcriptional regulator